MLHFYREYRGKLCMCVTWWRSVMSQSQGMKGGATEEAFQVQWFLWERGAPVFDQICGFLTFKTHYMHRNLYDTLKDRENKQKAEYVFFKMIRFIRMCTLDVCCWMFSWWDSQDINMSTVCVSVIHGNLFWQFSVTPEWFALQTGINQNINAVLSFPKTQ